MFCLEFQQVQRKTKNIGMVYEKFFYKRILEQGAAELSWMEQIALHKPCDFLNTETGEWSLSGNSIVRRENSRVIESNIKMIQEICCL